MVPHGLGFVGSPVVWGNTECRFETSYEMGVTFEPTIITYLLNGEIGIEHKLACQIESFGHQPFSGSGIVGLFKISFEG